MPVADALAPLAIYVVAMNVAGYLAFAYDKYCARNQYWRVPESSLLTLAILGGTIGVVIAQKTLRHKTRKEPFRTTLRSVALIQIIALLALFFLAVRDGLSSPI